VDGNERSLKTPRQAKLSRDGLTVVLVFASIIIAGLSMIQGQTIESQRNVIHLLFLDSKELNAIKAREAQQKHTPTSNNPSDQQEKSAPKSTCADSKDKKGCEAPQAVAPSRPAPDRNRTPERSDDDNSMPNPQRLLHSI